MKKIVAALVSCAFLIVASGQIPLPPQPTKSQLWTEVSRRLGVDRAIMTIITQDEWLAKKVAEVGISDISKSPSNQPLPYDTIKGWEPSNRFKLAVVDTEKESQMVALTKRIESLEKKLDDAQKVMALNSALIQGQIKKIADALASGPPLEKVPDVPIPAAETPPFPIPVPVEKPKKPFFPPIN